MLSVWVFLTAPTEGGSIPIFFKKKNMIFDDGHGGHKMFSRPGTADPGSRLLTPKATQVPGALALSSSSIEDSDIHILKDAVRSLEPVTSDLPARQSLSRQLYLSRRSKNGAHPRKINPSPPFGCPRIELATRVPHCWLKLWTANH